MRSSLRGCSDNGFATLGQDRRWNNCCFAIINKLIRIARSSDVPGRHYRNCDQQGIGASILPGVPRGAKSSPRLRRVLRREARELLAPNFDIFGKELQKLLCFLHAMVLLL